MFGLNTAIRDCIWSVIASYGFSPQFWENLVSFVYLRAVAESRAPNHPRTSSLSRATDLSCDVTDLPPGHAPPINDPPATSIPGNSFRRTVVGISVILMLIAAVAVYAPSEAPVCKVAFIKNHDWLGLCDTRDTLVKDVDPLERNEGWGVSRLSELAGLAHGNLTRVKHDLSGLTAVPFATADGLALLDQAHSLYADSFLVLLDLDNFVMTVRDELDFLLISYHDVDFTTLQFTAKLRHSDSLPDMATAMSKAISCGMTAGERLDLVISALDVAYSGLCVEISSRKGGYLPWKWWYARSKDYLHTLVSVRIRFSDALFDLKKARLGLNQLLRDILLLADDANRENVPEIVMAKRQVFEAGRNEAYQPVEARRRSRPYGHGRRKIVWSGATRGRRSRAAPR
ncbi:hypothetical protein BDZ89DRAFT_1051271 [Hymenopellis radicata]|nr:hypothetical protein BDZ89DRAFT_1051271 [Hymenopellis radicata]